MQTIAIVDYGMGNVRSVQKALEYVAPDQHCILTNKPQIIRDSDRVVFPGQGAMGACMSALQSNTLIEEIKFSAAVYVQRTVWDPRSGCLVLYTLGHVVAKDSRG